jgi:hypothetical protein
MTEIGFCYLSLNWCGTKPSSDFVWILSQSSDKCFILLILICILLHHVYISVNGVHLGLRIHCWACAQCFYSMMLVFWDGGIIETGSRQYTSHKPLAYSKRGLQQSF